eukprot:evm.model.NODE_42474_length_25988_cov_58.047985.3
MNILSLHVPVPTVPSPLSPPSFSSFFLPRPQGKRGSTLAHISTESGARLRLGHEEELPPGNNHERIVYVTGRKAERDMALALIQDKVGGHHFGALSQGYGPDAVVVKVPVRCVGTLMGSRGFKMKEIKEKTGARVTLSKMGDTEMGSNESSIILDGSTRQVNAAREMLRERVFAWRMQQSKEKAEKALAEASAEELGMEASKEEEEEEVTIKFSMPVPLVGHVIGRVSYRREEGLACLSVWLFSSLP